MVEEILFVARLSKYGGSNSLAAILDRNTCRFYGLAEGDLIQLKVSAIVKQKEKESSEISTSDSEIRKNADVGNLSDDLVNKASIIKISRQRQIGYNSGLSYKRRKRPFVTVLNQ